MHPRARREDAKSRSVEGDASGESAPSQVWEFFVILHANTHILVFLRRFGE